MKAIIGITTCPVSLLVRIWFEGQYSKPTPCEIWYLVLKPSMSAGESTRLLNLPIPVTRNDIKKDLKRKKVEKNKKKRKYKEMKTFKNTYTKSLKLSKDSQGILIETAMKLRDLECFVRRGAEILWNT